MRAPRTRTRLICAALACAGLVLAFGCERRPFEEKISARNDLAFSLWLSDRGRDFSADDLRELKEAQKQIKLAAMIDNPGLSAAEFEKMAYADIYGHTVREVFLRAIEISTARVNNEISALEEREQRYKGVDATRLSPEAREFLEGFNARMAQRRADLQRLEERKAHVLTR